MVARAIKLRYNNRWIKFTSVDEVTNSRSIDLEVNLKAFPGRRFDKWLRKLQIATEASPLLLVIDGVEHHAMAWLKSWEMASFFNGAFVARFVLAIDGGVTWEGL